MKRTCNKCGVEQDLETCFYKTGRKNDTNPNNRHYTCKTCTKTRVSAAHAANPNRAREAFLRRMYGITIAEYDSMLAKQGAKCACCSTEKAGGKHDVFCVDHDHVTNVVRQLLCKNCNIVLGITQDNPEHLMKLIQYLGKHQ